MSDVELAQCTLFPTGTKTARQRLLLKTHVELGNYAKLVQLQGRTVHMVASTKLLPLTKFPLTELQCVTVNQGTLETDSVSLHEFMVTGQYMRYSLVALGPPKFGKTPMCVAVASAIAQAESSSPHDAFFVKVSTLEGLGTCRAYCRQGVPIILDEVTPSQMRKLPEADYVKCLLDVASDATLTARYQDLALPALVPRLVTSNALSPEAWYPVLPANLLGMTAMERRMSVTESRRSGALPRGASPARGCV